MPQHASHTHFLFTTTSYKRLDHCTAVPPAPRERYSKAVLVTGKSRWRDQISCTNQSVGESKCTVIRLYKEIAVWLLLINCSDDCSLYTIVIYTLPWAMALHTRLDLDTSAGRLATCRYLSVQAHYSHSKSCGFLFRPRQTRSVLCVCHWRPSAAWEVTPYTRHLPLRSQFTARSMATAAYG